MSGGCFGQQRRGAGGHGAGLGADRQQLVTGGNYPKAKHVPRPRKCTFPFLRFFQFSVSGSKVEFCFVESKISIAG